MEKLDKLEILIGARYLREADEKSMKIKKPQVSDPAREKALSGFLDNCLDNKRIAKIIADHNAGKDTLLEIFNTLESQAACYWIKGSYVPAAALADPATLAFCLRAEKEGKFNMVVINQILGFFDGLTKKLVFPGDENDTLTRTR